MSILKLIPCCKDYLRGGHRLAEEYGTDALKEKNLLYAYKSSGYEIWYGFALKTSWILAAGEAAAGLILYGKCVLFCNVFRADTK